MYIDLTLILGATLNNTSNWHPEQPYNDLPALNFEKAILPEIQEAKEAISKLNAMAENFSDQEYLVHTLSLYESAANSEIEDIHTDLYQLFFIHDLDEKHFSKDTVDVLNCFKAMKKGLELIQRKPVITNTAVEICQVLKGTTLDVRKTTGTAIRDSEGKIVYTPPEGEGIIRNHLAQWENYLNTAENVDPLVRMAEAHYQFEAIHPFIDGNGRTGRILNQLFLIDCGLMKLPILCMSAVILQNLNGYYALLRRVTTNQDWKEWTLFMLKMVIESCRNVTDIITNLNEIKKNHIDGDLHTKFNTYLASQY